MELLKNTTAFCHYIILNPVINSKIKEQWWKGQWERRWALCSWQSEDWRTLCYIWGTCNCEAIEIVAFYKPLILRCYYRSLSEIAWIITLYKNQNKKLVLCFRQLRGVFLLKIKWKSFNKQYTQSLLSFGIEAWGGAKQKLFRDFICIKKFYFESCIQ